MTAESLACIETAIRLHLATLRDDAVLTDWFIAFGSMRHEPDADDGISHGVLYASSQASPQGALGIATLGLASLTDDLAFPDDEDE